MGGYMQNKNDVYNEGMEGGKWRTIQLKYIQLIQILL